MVADVRIITSFSARDYDTGLAALWARGLQQFWPDHPPVRIIDDGSHYADHAAGPEVALLCGGEWVQLGQAMGELKRCVSCDIAELAAENFWVRFLLTQYLCADAKAIIWDDVDGLFLRRPEGLITAIAEQPDAVISVWAPDAFIQRARWLWSKVDPDLPALRRRQTPVVGTHYAPVALVRDRLDQVEAYLRLWQENNAGEQPGSGAVCAMGLWQGLAMSWPKRVALRPERYQIDYCSLHLRPELVHACSQKCVHWYWRAFLDGYADYLEDPRDTTEDYWWLKSGSGSVPTA